MSQCPNTTSGNHAYALANDGAMYCTCGDAYVPINLRPKCSGMCAVHCNQPVEVLTVTVPQTDAAIGELRLAIGALNDQMRSVYERLDALEKCGIPKSTDKCSFCKDPRWTHDDSGICGKYACRCEQFVEAR